MLELDRDNCLHLSLSITTVFMEYCPFGHTRRNYLRHIVRLEKEKPARKLGSEIHNRPIRVQRERVWFLRGSLDRVSSLSELRVYQTTQATCFVVKDIMQGD